MHRGEKMSEVVGELWTRNYIFQTPNGDIWEDDAHCFIDRPLDTGRLLFCKLSIEFGADDVEIEVWFDHFDNTITAQMKRGDDVREVTFYDQSMARSEKLVYVNRLVYEAKGAFA